MDAIEVKDLDVAYEQKYIIKNIGKNTNINCMLVNAIYSKILLRYYL